MALAASAIVLDAERGRSLCDVAARLAQFGRFDDAGRMAGMIVEEAERGRAQAHIALFKARAGDVDRALDDVARIASSSGADGHTRAWSARPQPADRTHRPPFRNRSFQTLRPSSSPRSETTQVRERGHTISSRPFPRWALPSGQGPCSPSGGAPSAKAATPSWVASTRTAHCCLPNCVSSCQPSDSTARREICPASVAP